MDWAGSHCADVPGPCDLVDVLVSGYFILKERLACLSGGEKAVLVCSGSHLRSIELVLEGGVDAAAIDSNVLRRLMQDPSVARQLRVVDSWGPRPIQPTIARASLDPSIRAIAAATLLFFHESNGALLRRSGFLRFVTGDPSSYVMQPKAVGDLEAASSRR